MKPIYILLPTIFLSFGYIVFIIGRFVGELKANISPDLIIYDEDGRHVCEIRTYQAGVIHFVEAVDMSNGKVIFQTWSEFNSDAKKSFHEKLKNRGSYELFNDDKLK